MKKLGLILASLGVNLLLIGTYLNGKYERSQPKKYIVVRDHLSVRASSLNLDEEAGKLGKLGERGYGGVLTVEMSADEFEHKAIPPGLIVEPIVHYKIPKPLSLSSWGCSQDPRPTLPPQNPNQPSQSIDWGIMRVEAPDVQLYVPSDKIKVCVLDTGIDQMHPDLTYNIGMNFTSADQNDYQDRMGHGTHTAGLVAARNNNIGVLGASDAQLLIGKVLDDEGSGENGWIAQGIYWCADQKADIISMSLGGPYPSSVVQNAILYATGKGAKVFAAAGNEGSSQVGYPAGYRIPGLYSIAATDKYDRLAYFSNYGKVEFACPGVDIFSTMPGGNYGTMSGTSMATPICAGIAALYLARGRPLSAEYMGDEYHFGSGILSAKALLLEGF